MTEPTPHDPKSLSRTALSVLLLIVGLAVVLQWSRLPFRWNPVALAYAAYFHEFRHAISLNGSGAAFTTFVGLHPPAYSLFFLWMMEASAPAVCWLASSGLFSVASVPLVWMTARLANDDGAMPWPSILSCASIAALVLELSPHRNAYGLEVNNYPLLLAVTAAQLYCFAQMTGPWQTSPEQARPLLTQPTRAEVAWVLTSALSIWTHVLSIALPCSQLLLVILLPESRRHVKRLILLATSTAALCLPLLPGVLAGLGSDPINVAPGLDRALAAALLDFPGRYGSEIGANLLAAMIVLAAANVVRLPPGHRLVPLSWLAHGLVAGALVVGMVAAGMAAAHQFPYYLVLLPAGALLVPRALHPDQTPVMRYLLLAVCATALSLHALALGSDALRGRAAWTSANSERGLIAIATQSWQDNSSLLLHGFPQTMDDDKDVLDAAFAFIPLDERITFAQPQVETLVPGDPNWGQPLLFEGHRWLYTFTDFKEDRVDAITDAALARGERVIVAAYNTRWAQREADELRAWAAARGEPGRRAKDQLMFILEPTVGQQDPLPDASHSHQPGSSTH